MLLWVLGLAAHVTAGAMCHDLVVIGRPSRCNMLPMAQRGRRYFRFDGDALAARRNQSGLTQAQLAEKLDVSDRVIQTWEAGGRALRARIERNKAALRQVLGVSAESLDAALIDPDREQVVEHIEEFLRPVLERRYKGLPPFILPLEELQATVVPGSSAKPAINSRSIGVLYRTTVQATDATRRTMVIIGDAGTGKSVLLLDLAEYLLSETMRGSTRPVVLWLDSGSWAEEPQSFGHWIANRLRIDYEVDPEVAKRWSGRALDLRLLLDGFDDIPLRQRQPFLRGLDEFLSRPGCTHAAVLSARSNELEALSASLAVCGVAVRRLRAPDVRNYLKTRTANHKLAILKALGADKSLYDVLDTPLKINLAAEALLDQSVRPGSLGATEAERFAKLLHLYLDRLVQAHSQLDSARVLMYLAWLAEMLTNKTADNKLRIEAMQPDWLPTRVQRAIVMMGSVALCGLIVGVAFSSR